MLYLEIITPFYASPLWVPDEMEGKMINLVNQIQIHSGIAENKTIFKPAIFKYMYFVLREEDVHWWKVLLLYSQPHYRDCGFLYET